MKNNVSVSNLHKVYQPGNVKALDGINFEVHPGELFGLIGPDGAGKTSLFRILTTLLLADQGTANVCGWDVVKDLWEIRKIVGYMPGKFSLYQDLSVIENLDFFATLFNTTVAENYHLIKDIYVQIEPFKDRPAGKLSGGMKQKLALCCALVHEPQVLFLDEPTTGVDPVSRVEFWNMLHLLKQKGITIIVSTPYMDEASQCDRLALIQQGQILDLDTYEGILAKNDQVIYQVKGDHMYPLLRAIRSFEGTAHCFAFGDSHHVTMNPGYAIKDLQEFLNGKELKGVQIRQISAGIEDTFIHLLQTDPSKS